MHLPVPCCHATCSRSSSRSVIGRGKELSLLRELVAPPYEESRVLLLLGNEDAWMPVPI
jgi:hypothetical protein